MRMSQSPRAHHGTRRFRGTRRPLVLALLAALAIGVVPSTSTLAASVPDAPRSLTAVAGNGQATLSWQAPSWDGGDWIRGYNIFRNGIFIGSIGREYSYTATGLTNGTTYRFKVSAWNGLGGGSYSNEVSVTPRSTTTSGSTGGFTDLTGWKLVFSDEFSTNIARGSFKSATAGRYFVFPNTWRDTSGNGVYSPEIIAVQNGMLDIEIKTVNGVHKVATISPLPAGALSSEGDLYGLRAEFRLRADWMPRYKAAPLLWPKSDRWPYDGEINFPEADFNENPRAYMHRQGASSPSDQDYYFTPSTTWFQDWHTYVIEWIPGKSCEFFLDGKSIGRSTYRVPNSAMHLNLQFETSIRNGEPADSTTGHIQIDRLAVWTLK
jgi:hypothetical protein